MQLTISEMIGSFVQLLLFCFIPFIWWVCTARKKESFFSWIGLKKGHCKTSVMKMILFSVIVAGCYIAVTILCVNSLPEGITTAGSQFAGQGAAAIPAVIAYALIRTALAEEILFRGFFLKRVSAKFGFIAGNTVQALLFGLLHGIPFGVSTGSAVTAVVMTVLPGVMGWYEGWMNEKQFEGSVLPGWMLHGTLNVITSVLSL